MTNLPSLNRLIAAHGDIQAPLVAPFRVIADIREKANGWRFEDLPSGVEHRSWQVLLEYRPLEMPCYTIEDAATYIVRHTARDFITWLRPQPNRIAHEFQHLRRLEASGASCLIIIEGAAESFLQTIERYGSTQQLDALESAAGAIPWLFAPTRRAAQISAFEIMHRAWQRAQEK